MAADDDPIPSPSPSPSLPPSDSPTHSDSVLALLPIPSDPDHDWPWQPILHHSNQVVLYNPTSHALSIRHSPSSPSHSPSHSPFQSRIQSHIQSHIQARSRSHDVQRPECPYCHRPFPRHDHDQEEDEEYEYEGDMDMTMAVDSESEPSSAYHSRASNYFQLLAIANETASRPPSPPPPPTPPPPIERTSRSRHRSSSTSHGRHRDRSTSTSRRTSSTTRAHTSQPQSQSTTTAFPAEKMADGYFSAFFQEESRLGMGASGTVFLCRHVLDGNYLGHFAVKKIAVGESHSYLLKILREVRLLERLHHPNIITYHHAWLETCQFSQFGPKVPTLHVLMQWAEGGSLDDFIDARLGRSSGTHHLHVSGSGSGSGLGSGNTNEAPGIDTDINTDTDTAHQSRSARIRAFRAYQRASPEERKAMRAADPTANSLPFAGVAPGFGGNGLGIGPGFGLGDGFNGNGINGTNGTGMNGRNTTWTPVHLLSPEEVKSLFADVVEGLAFLHNKSILHLDLKPGNVLLTWDEGRLIPRAMLSDFGTSRDTLHSSSLTTTPRSGNTGTLEYTAPESLPSPGTGTGRLPSPGTGRVPSLQEVNSKGRLREVDSKADMWSLGMILHKLLFFRLPYRYASDGDETSEPQDGAGRLDKLEREVLEYPGFKSTPPLITSFESRRLPRAYLVLLESLLNVNPGSRPSCERVGGAIREGRLDPLRLETDPGTAGAVTTLIPLTRQRSNPDGNSGTTIRVENPPFSERDNKNENTDTDTSERRTGTPPHKDTNEVGTAVPQSKETETDAFSSSSMHPRSEDSDGDGAMNTLGWTVDVANNNTNTDDLRRIPRLRLLWIRMIKSVILIAKVWNILSLCPHHNPTFLSSLLLAAALLDTLFDGLWIFSMVLGLLHVLVVRIGCTGGRCCG